MSRRCGCVPAAAWGTFPWLEGDGDEQRIWSVVVGVTDNVLRPILIRRGADLPLILLLVGVIGGLFAFGIIGLFVGPVVLAVAYTLLDAWVNDSLEPDIAAVDGETGGGDQACPETRGA